MLWDVCLDTQSLLPSDGYSNLFDKPSAKLGTLLFINMNFDLIRLKEVYNRGSIQPEFPIL